MSHIRNLFHKPPTSATQPAPALSIAAAPETVVPITTAIAPLPEFPVEKAQISPENRLVFHTDPRSRAADRFRFLRMRLREHWTAGKLKKVLVTSPLARDGKSTVVLNLATALSERGKRSVVVVEADLHHSSIAPSLKLSSWAGLTECLQDSSPSPLSHIRRIEPLGWHLLPAGEPRRNPTELLQSPVLGAVIQKLSTCFDWVLIDSPPAVLLTDAIAIQQHADGTLLVVRAGQTPREAIDQSVALLGQKNIVGMVLNGIERRNQPHFQQPYYNNGGGNED